ncbi:hypothetical protein REC12_23745 [Desulfosporosinus sp. PR]|uniref:hypothetical protein n=1 Tax=Candidatus Desulfosporosinus nitrosoreducens TaxID=3401928 RepID=UPI0027F02F54|nr:hypothetical protein [Desulfosporosinus sp. PR]MDQ7096613.1 hypothetical protein [Desulfosporosinus sp. PR]
MIKSKSKVVSIALMVIATAFMIFAIWTENMSISTRPFIVLGYLLLMTFAMLISGKSSNLKKK